MMIQRKSSQIQFEVKHDVPVLSRQKNMFSSKSIKILSFSERVDKIKRLQQNYGSLKNISLNLDASDTPRMNLNNGILNIQNTSISLSSLPHQIAAIEMENIKTLKLVNASLSDDLFSLILDYFTEPNIMGLRELIIEKCSFSNMDKISERIKLFVE